MNYKQPCRACGTVIDHNFFYCPFCGQKNPCGDENEVSDLLEKPVVAESESKTDKTE